MEEGKVEAELYRKDNKCLLENSARVTKWV